MVTLIMAGAMVACGKSDVTSDTTANLAETTTEKIGIVGTYKNREGGTLTFAADGTFVWERDYGTVEGTYVEVELEKDGDIFDQYEDSKWELYVDGELKWAAIVGKDGEGKFSDLTIGGQGEFDDINAPNDKKDLFTYRKKK